MVGGAEKLNLAQVSTKQVFNASRLLICFFDLFGGQLPCTHVPRQFIKKRTQT
jgi:hypothetical protein